MSLLSKMPGLAKHRTEPVAPKADAAPPTPPAGLPRHGRGVSAQGLPYVLAYRDEDLEALQAAYSEPVFGPEEIGHLRGMTREEAHYILAACTELGGTVERTRLLGERARGRRR